MARYDVEFRLLATRAAEQGAIDLKTWAARRLNSGAAPADLVSELVSDLDRGGPIFGGYLRALGGAAANASVAAARQGLLVGHAMEDAALRQLLARQGIDGPVLGRVAEDADPEEAQAIEDTIGQTLVETWVAMLRNTCDRCLPLHGVERTHEEWQALQLLPETIHDGWNSPCYCTLVPSSIAQSHAELAAPLMRIKVEKGQARTRRAIASDNLDRAVSARDASVKSKEGRSMLRQLGKSGGE